METVKKENYSIEKKTGSRFPFGIFIGANISISLGMLFVTSAAAWDVTFHLLTYTESFFSPPHLIIYSGITMALFASLLAFLGWYHLSEQRKDLYRFPLKLALLGIALLVSGGPADYWWHETFGLNDGVLSPSHALLFAGMFLCAIGSFVSLTRFINNKIQGRSKAFSFLMIIAVLPVWQVVAEMFYSYTLPFSETDNFNFNPDPTFAIIFATLSLPFLTSFILLLGSKLVNYKFGIISLTGILMGIIHLLTSILPNETLHHTIPFYFLNVIPIIIADLIISQYPKKRLGLFSAGAILGSIFYMMYYPLQTYTYNEILLQKDFWPSSISQTYFEMLELAYPLVIGPAIIMGIIGAVYSKKIARKIIGPLRSY